MHPSRAITLLHLSDTQFGRNHRFGRLGLPEPDVPFDTLFARLREDLRFLKDKHGLDPDLVIASGDLAEWGKKKEFDDVLELTEWLAQPEPSSAWPRTPRMLGFIADLPEEQLRQARERAGEITAAALYGLLIERWLEHEQSRAEPRGASLSPLMADFLAALAVPTGAALRDWVRDVSDVAAAEGEVVKRNALMINQRLRDPVQLGANLAGQDLRGQDLSGRRDLAGADLRGADLRDTRLVGADLTGARLTEARLAGADLSRALLRDADLEGADGVTGRVPRS